MQSLCSFTTTLLTSDRVTRQAYDTLRVKLGCSPWFSSKKLSQRHTVARPLRLTLLLLVKWDKLSSSSVQLSETDGAAAVLHQLFDARHWKKKNRSPGITHHDQLELGEQITTGVACCGFSTPLMLRPTSQLRWGLQTHQWLSHTSTVSCCLWMPGSEMDLRRQQSFCESCCSHHLLAGSAFEPSKAQEGRAAKAEQFGLPGVLFGLWIKWSPGLGAGATSCPCLASKGSYSFPS